mmetsp:Transcript_99029/g.186049  ORF Transcript_99029/g.186049 Transcript_99029/m.186049 type:complete len:244 (-) Transcript_99029:263-994(-)
MGLLQPQHLAWREQTRYCHPAGLGSAMAPRMRRLFQRSQHPKLPPAPSRKAPVLSQGGLEYLLDGLGRLDGLHRLDEVRGLDHLHLDLDPLHPGDLASTRQALGAAKLPPTELVSLQHCGSRQFAEPARMCLHRKRSEDFLKLMEIDGFQSMSACPRRDHPLCGPQPGELRWIMRLLKTWKRRPAARDVRPSWSREKMLVEMQPNGDYHDDQKQRTNLYASRQISSQHTERQEWRHLTLHQHP